MEEFGRPERTAESDANAGIIDVKQPQGKAIRYTPSQDIKEGFTANLDKVADAIAHPLGMMLKNHADEYEANSIMAAQVRQGIQEGVNDVDLSRKRSDWLVALAGEDVSYRAAQQLAVGNSLAMMHIEDLNGIDKHAAMTPEEFADMRKKTLNNHLEKYDDTETKAMIVNQYAKNTGEVLRKHTANHIAYAARQANAEYKKSMLLEFDRLTSLSSDISKNPERSRLELSKGVDLVRGKNRPVGISEEAHINSLVEVVNMSLEEGNAGGYNLMRTSGMLRDFTLSDKQLDAVKASVTKYENAKKTEYEGIESMIKVAAENGDVGFEDMKNNLITKMSTEAVSEVGRANLATTILQLNGVKEKFDEGNTARAKRTQEEKDATTWLDANGFESGVGFKTNGGILGFTSGMESGRDPGIANTGVAGHIYSDSNGKRIDVSKMTVDQIIKAHGLGAAGLFQMVGGTITGARDGGYVKGSDVFDAKTQVKASMYLLSAKKRPMTYKYIIGSSNDITSAYDGLRNEFSVYPADKGQKYDTRGNNHPQTSVEKGKQALIAAREEYRQSIARGDSPDTAWMNAMIGKQDVSGLPNAVKKQILVDSLAGKAKIAKDVLQIQENEAKLAGEAGSSQGYDNINPPDVPGLEGQKMRLEAILLAAEGKRRVEQARMNFDLTYGKYNLVMNNNPAALNEIINSTINNSGSINAMTSEITQKLNAESALEAHAKTAASNAEKEAEIRNAAAAKAGWAGLNSQFHSSYVQQTGGEPLEKDVHDIAKMLPSLDAASKELKIGSILNGRVNAGRIAAGILNNANAMAAFTTADSNATGGNTVISNAFNSFLSNFGGHFDVHDKKEYLRPVSQTAFKNLKLYEDGGGRMSEVLKPDDLLRWEIFKQGVIGKKSPQEMNLEYEKFISNKGKDIPGLLLKKDQSTAEYVEEILEKVGVKTKVSQPGIGIQAEDALHVGMKIYRNQDMAVDYMKKTVLNNAVRVHNFAVFNSELDSIPVKLTDGKAAKLRLESVLDLSEQFKREIYPRIHVAPGTAFDDVRVNDITWLEGIGLRIQFAGQSVPTTLTDSDIKRYAVDAYSIDKMNKVNGVRRHQDVKTVRGMPVIDDYRHAITTKK